MFTFPEKTDRWFPVQEFLEISKAERGNLTGLTLGACPTPFFMLSPTEIKQIAIALSECKNLTEISFFCSGLAPTPENMEVLLSPLPKLPNLKKMNLSANSITCVGLPCVMSDESFVILCSIVSNCHLLEELNFWANSLGGKSADGFKAFSKILTNCLKLKALNLNYNQLGLMDEEKTMILANGIALSRSLVSIDLGDSGIIPDMWQRNHLTNLDPVLLKGFFERIVESPNLDQVSTDRLSSELQSDLNDALLRNRFKAAIQGFEKSGSKPIPEVLQLRMLSYAFPEHSEEKLGKLYRDSYNELFFPERSDIPSATRKKS